MNKALLNLWGTMVCSATVAAFPRAGLLQAATVPVPIGEGTEAVYPYNFTGLVENAYYYGSGVVARNPKLVISCAHVTYDGTRNRWLKSPYWYLAWNDSSYPNFRRGLLLNGYVYWESYALAVQRYGQASARAFEWDLVGYFNYSTDTAGGGYAGAWEDGVSALLGSAPKLITGYPAGRYKDGDPRQSQMHGTGYFNAPFTVDRGRYLGLDGVETGAGNSGGPVWVSNGTTPLLAGILVSGLEYKYDRFSSIGVVGLETQGWQLIDSALSMEGVSTYSFSNTMAARIPNPGTLRRTIKVTGLPRTTRGIEVALKIPHSRRADLLVTLRSPSRRTITLFNGEASEAGENLLINGQDYSNFDGLDPNGEWVLTVRDRYRGNLGYFQGLTLKISAQ